MDRYFPLPPRPRFALAAIAAGSLLRLVFLTRQPLWVDELLTVDGASLGHPFRWADVLANPQGPLPHLLLRIWTAGFGTGDLALRAWAAGAGILGLVLAAWIFPRLLRRGSDLALWLLALSPFHIWYSQEVRNYVFLILFALLAVWTFHEVRERPRIRNWILHGACLSAVSLSNLSGLFLLPALVVAVLLDPRARKGAWALTALASLLVVSPWLVVEFGGHVDWSPLATAGTAPGVRGPLTFHPGALPFTLAVFAGGYGLGPPLREMHEGLGLATFASSLPALVLAAAAVLTAGGAAALRIRDPEVRFLFLWLGFPILLSMLVSVLGLKAFNPRYAAVAHPAFLLILGRGVAQLWARRPAAGYLVAGLLLAVSLFGWGRQTLDPDYAREDFREAARVLEARTQPGDLILEQGVHRILGRYYRGPAEIRPFYAVYFSEPDSGWSRLDLGDGSRRIWWVGSRLWLEDPDLRLRNRLRDRGEMLGEERVTGIEILGVEIADP